MLSSKLTALKSLASASLDGFFLFGTLCHTNDDKDPPRKFKASPSTDLPLYYGRCSMTVRKPWNVSLELNLSAPTKWMKKDEEVQTDAELHSFSLETTEEQLSECAHMLNISQCMRASSSSGFHDTSPPSIWTVLGLMDYSPALFNLGVWYERRARTHCSNSSSNYLDKAEEAYSRALQIDVHPLASYNLACLLLSTKRSHAKAGTQTYSVDDLMSIAARHGVKEAKDYLRQRPSSYFPSKSP